MHRRDGAREGGSFQRSSELPCVVLQPLGLGLEVPQRGGAWVLEHSMFGGQSYVLEQAAKVAAAAKDLIACVPVLGLLTQRVHQLLPHHDNQLALGDKALRGLAVAKAAVKDTDGFEERPEVEPAVFRKVDLLLGILGTPRAVQSGAGILGKRKKTVDKRWSPSTGCACLPLPGFSQFARLFRRKRAVLFGKSHSATLA